MKPDKLIIEEICEEKSSELKPTLLKFQNGKMAVINKANTSFYKAKNKITNKEEAVVECGEQIYHGAINDDLASDLTDTYILVRNKTTNKVRILPMEQATLKNYLYTKLAKQHDEQQMNDLSKEQAQKTLLKQFAGRKTSRYADNREQMKMNVNFIRKELESTLNESNIDDDGAAPADISVNNNSLYLETVCPPCDKNAKKVEDIYDLNDILTEELVDRLDEEAKVIYGTKCDTLPVKSQFLLNHIKKIQEKETPTAQDFRHIKAIIYMDALHTLISSRVRIISKIELSKISEKVENSVRVRFADPNVPKAYTRTAYSTEKALTYFIVLALLISEKYEVDMNVLAQTLSTTKKKISVFAHAANALVKPRTDILQLTLPADVPPLRKRRSLKK